MIVIQNLKKVYHQQIVLNDLSTQISKGEIVAILGSSGSGKSTLLRCINRMEEPTSGEILLNGVLLTSSNIQRYRSQLGMVFQSFNLFSNMRVIENLTYAPTHVNGVAFEVALEKAKGLLKQVGLEKKADVFPHTLSGGEKQRVAIARTLMMDPSVILFDEPTSALDPAMVQEVLKVIKGLASSGITILIVTHEMSFVRDVATRVLFLEHGRILEDLSTREFFEGKGRERISQFLGDTFR